MELFVLITKKISSKRFSFLAKCCHGDILSIFFCLIQCTRGNIVSSYLFGGNEIVD